MHACYCFRRFTIHLRHLLFKYMRWKTLFVYISTIILHWFRTIHFAYARSPLILLASWMSLGMMVTLLAWIAQRLVSSKSPTRYASADSWRARIAADWNLRSVLKSWAISLTSLWNGSFLIKSSVDFWYFLISRRATVPGLYLCGFLTPPAVGADFLAAFVANCFLGALPPVDLRAL